MKRILKCFLLLCLALVLQLTTIPQEVFAEEENTDESIDMSQSILYQYNTDDPTIKSEIEFLKTNAISLTSQKYYKKLESKDSIKNSKIYTYSEYIKEIRKEKISENQTINESNGSIAYSIIPGTDYTKSNSWMELTVESYKLVGDQYKIYLHYRWLTRPIWQQDDTIAIGYDSNLTCDTTSVYGYHVQEPILSPYSRSVVINRYSDNSVKTDIHGIASQFNIAIPNNIAYSLYGYIVGNFRFSNTNHISANMEFFYGHQQLSFDYNIQDAIDFATSGDVTLNIIGDQDEFKFADEFLRR